MNEWHDDIVPFAVQVWLQRKFWPLVETSAFGTAALVLAIACWGALAGGLAGVFERAGARFAGRTGHGQGRHVARVPDFLGFAKACPHIGFGGHALFQLGDALLVAARQPQDE